MPLELADHVVGDRLALRGFAQAEDRGGLDVALLPAPVELVALGDRGDRAAGGTVVAADEDLLPQLVAVSEPVRAGPGLEDPHPPQAVEGVVADPAVAAVGLRPGIDPKVDGVGQGLVLAGANLGRHALPGADEGAAGYHGAPALGDPRLGPRSDRRAGGLDLAVVGAAVVEAGLLGGVHGRVAGFRLRLERRSEVGLVAGLAVHDRVDRPACPLHRLVLGGDVVGRRLALAPELELGELVAQALVLVQLGLVGGRELLPALTRRVQGDPLAAVRRLPAEGVDLRGRLRLREIVAAAAAAEQTGGDRDERDACDPPQPDSHDLDPNPIRTRYPGAGPRAGPDSDSVPSAIASSCSPRSSSPWRSQRKSSLSPTNRVSTTPPPMQLL